MLYLTRASTTGGASQLRWSYPKLEHLRRSAASFESIAGFTRADVNITGGREPERVVAEVVSASYFRTLRVEAALGRTFLPEEDRDPGGPPVAVLAYGLWQRRFGGDPSIIGHTTSVNSVALTVVGVLPRSFRGLSDRADLWVTSVMAPRLTYADYLTTPQNFINAVARLKPGVPTAQASAEMDTLGRQIEAELPTRSLVPAAYGATLIPCNAARIDPASRRQALVLFGAVVCVLAIACANVAGLLLSRAEQRARELAVRSALGAGRGRLIRQLLTESVLLSLAGGVLGILAAAWGEGALGSFAPGIVGTPRNDYAQLGAFSAPRMDLRVLVFALLASVVTGLVCGLLPALRASGGDLAGALKEGARGSSQALGSLGRFRSLSALVVSEIALSLVLLTAAGLLLESLARLLAVDPGFQPGNLIAFWVNPPASKYRPGDGPAVVEKILTAVSAAPGVRMASVSRCAPYMSTCARTTLFLEGQPEPPPGTAPIVGRHYVGPDHFRALGIPLARGRSFTPDDRAGRPAVTIVNRAAARRFWPGEDPIGKRVWFGSGTGFNSRQAPVEIVGVVGDVRYWPPEEEPGPDFYTCYLQFTYPDTMVFVRAGGDPRSVIAGLRSAVQSVDPDLPIYDIKTLAERSGDALARPRYYAALVGAFAATALLLAAIGIYGVIASSVTARTQEIGIRMALGARAGTVVALVLGGSLRLTLAGIALGIAGSLAAARALRGMLYGIEPTDLRTLAVVSLIVTIVSAAASLIPARRAAGIDPIAALRRE
jgi:predicted permease